MKHLYAVLGLLIVAGSCSAQDYLWHQQQSTSWAELDTLGNVFVQGFGGTTLYKYDAGDGSPILNYNYGSGVTIKGYTLDPGGNFYIAGHQTGTGEDIAVAKYDPYGTMLWSTTYNGTANKDDIAKGLALDAAGNVYITGITNDDGSANGNADAITIKYGPGGSQLWLMTFDGLLGQKDEARGIAVNDAGEVFIVGATQDYTQIDSIDTYVPYGLWWEEPVTATKAFLLKYNSSGTQQWIEKSADNVYGAWGWYYNPILYNKDAGLSVKTHGTDVFVVWEQIDNSAEPWPFVAWPTYRTWRNTIERFRSHVKKFTSNGVEQWSQSMPQTCCGVGYSQNVQDMRFDSTGACYVQIKYSTSPTYYLRKYNPNGTQAFSKTFNHPTTGLYWDVRGGEMLTATTELVTVPGQPYNYVTKYDLAGNTLWHKDDLAETSTSPFIGYGVSFTLLDDNGDVFTIGSSVAKHCGAVPTVSVSNDTSVCFGSAAQLLGSTDAAAFSWSPGTDLSDSSILNPVASNLANATFNLTGTFPNGCSRTESVTLSVSTGAPINLPAVAICNGNSAMIFGQSQSLPGTYYDTLITGSGCDSILSQALIVNSPVSNLLSPVAICDGESALVAGSMQSTAGLYTDTLFTALGCDSLVTQELMLEAVDQTVQNNNGLLTALATSATFQWIDCATGQVIPGAINASFAPTANGSYAVILDQFGCTDTSACLSVALTSLAPTAIPSIRLFPNPAKDQIRIDLPAQASFAEVELRSLEGALIRRMHATSSERLVFDLADVPSGAYFLHIAADERRSVMKVIKE